MAALEATIAGRFDCFIFDVSMPGMSGIELLNEFAIGAFKRRPCS